jgi:hypothetical protein
LDDWLNLAQLAGYNHRGHDLFLCSDITRFSFTPNETAPAVTVRAAVCFLFSQASERSVLRKPHQPSVPLKNPDPVAEPSASLPNSVIE